MEEGPRVHGTIQGSSSPHSKPFFVFNHQGKIDLIHLYDFNHLYYEAPIHTDKAVPLDDIANACIVYHVAQSIGVVPGMFSCGDKALVEELKYRLRDRFIDKDAEVKRLMDSWANIAAHPLARPYKNLYDTRPMSWSRVGRHFSIIDSFDLFVRAYLVGLSQVLACGQSIQQNIDKYLQAITLIHANHHGQWFFVNDYIQWPILKSHVDECFARLPEDNRVQALKEMVDAKCAFQRRMWFTQNRDFIKLEVNGFHDAFKDHMTQLGHILYFFCQGKDYTDLEELLDREVREIYSDLKQTSLILHNPSHIVNLDGHSYRSLILRRDVGKPPADEEISASVVGVVYQYACSSGIFGFKDDRPQPVWANMGLSQEGDLFHCTLIMDKNIDITQFPMYVLYHLAAKAKDEALRKLLFDEIEQRCELEGAISSLGRMTISRPYFRSGAFIANPFAQNIVCPGSVPFFLGLGPTLQRCRGGTSLQMISTMPLIAAGLGLPASGDDELSRASPITSEGIRAASSEEKQDDEHKPSSASSSRLSSVVAEDSRDEVDRDSGEPSLTRPSSVWLPSYMHIVRTIQGDRQYRINGLQAFGQTVDGAMELVDETKIKRGWFPSWFS